MSDVPNHTQRSRSPCDGCVALDMCKPDKKGCPQFREYFVASWDEAVEKIKEGLHEREETQKTAQEGNLGIESDVLPSGGDGQAGRV